MKQRPRKVLALNEIVVDSEKVTPKKLTVQEKLKGIGMMYPGWLMESSPRT
jgi:hypothetical protein